MLSDDVIVSTSAESSDAPMSEDETEDSSKIFPPKIDEDYLKSVRLYESKNDYLRHSPQFHEIDTDTFLRLIFCRDGYDRLPFEEEWCDSYDWWVSNNEENRKEKRPARFNYEYNGIAQAIYGKEDENKNLTFVITSQAERLHKILRHPFVIMSPVSYTGKRRTKTNARYLYAIAIDIDDVDGENVENLFYQSDPTRPHITFPQPQIVVNSGGGIHIYFILENPRPMFNDTYTILNKIKKELTRRVWNRGTTHMNPDKPQYQGNCQGFRLPGTKTKTGHTVTAFQNINPHAKPYYTIEDLACGGGGFLRDDEVKLLKQGIYDPYRVSLERARELYPEWYERRIVRKITPNRWYVNRYVYDNWKERIFINASVGHRYFCLMALAIFARKCRQLTFEEFKAVYAEKLEGLSERQIRNRYEKKKAKGVSEEEFKKDLMDFVDVMDGLSLTQKAEDRFTVDDALDAAAAYRECYCTFPMADLRDITGVEMEKNQRRNYRKQEEHLEEARIIRDLRQGKKGRRWDDNNGRKNKADLVISWRQEHPDGTKYACAKELGISKPTVMRWWNVIETGVVTHNRRKTQDVNQESSLARKELNDIIGPVENGKNINYKEILLQLVKGIENIPVTLLGGYSPEELAKILNDEELRAKSNIEFIKDHENRKENENNPENGDVTRE